LNLKLSISLTDEDLISETAKAVLDILKGSIFYELQHLQKVEKAWCVAIAN
jgi:hypothetical protein